MAYGILVPFLPIIFEKRGIRVYWTGITFGTFSIAYLLVAPLFGSIVDKFGHRNMIVTGILLMSTSMALFGAIVNIETNSAALIVAIILRSCQGKYNYALQCDLKVSNSTFRHFIEHDKYSSILLRSPSIRRKL